MPHTPLTEGGRALLIVACAMVACGAPVRPGGRQQTDAGASVEPPADATATAETIAPASAPGVATVAAPSPPPDAGPEPTPAPTPDPSTTVAPPRCADDPPGLPAGVDCSLANPVVALAKDGRYIECPADIPRVTQLTLDRKLERLDGIECFENLESLSIGFSGIEDLGPIAGLVKLRFLQANGNRIRDLRPLARLVRLEELTLNWNAITDVGPLAGLVELRQLELAENAIVDVAPLAGLTRLESLVLDLNRIVKIAPLRRLVAAGTLGDLRIEKNRIRDLRTLRGTPIWDYVENARQYAGSCLDLLRANRLPRSRGPARKPFVVCPEWEDEEVRKIIERYGKCGRLERICGYILGIDCASGVGGSYYYVDANSGETLCRQGQHMLPDDEPCPPPQLKCPAY